MVKNWKLKNMITGDTTDPQYWLNWRFAMCAVNVLSCMLVASFLICKYEGPNSESSNEERHDTDHTRIWVKPGSVYVDETWRPCLKQIHPAWLLAFRLVSFFSLLSLLIVDVRVDGASIFFYYTEWTFLLVTLYFALGSVLSIHGCYQYLYKAGRDNADLMRSDAEQGRYIVPPTEESAQDHFSKTTDLYGVHDAREIAGFWGYMLQIMYQINAGAVMLTDSVFWLIIYPFLVTKDYSLDFLLIGTHSINVVFMIGDVALNSLRFPWFRIGYFLLWTGIYVVFQWITHAAVSMWWPYPFLDLSSSRAPIWYLAVALLHIPCYAVFPLVLRLKHSLLEAWFPDSCNVTE